MLPTPNKNPQSTQPMQCEGQVQQALLEPTTLTPGNLAGICDCEKGLLE